MQTIGQHSIFKSQQNALLPSSVRIDGRNEIELLYFLSEYASLINFYDETNTQHGNWAPFLLKDPVFICAHIAHSNYTKKHQLFQKSILSLSNTTHTVENLPELTKRLNELFYQLTDVFISIEKWSKYMLQTDENYTLKTFLVDKIKELLAPEFWAILSMMKTLSLCVPELDFATFDPNAFTSTIWTQSKDKNTYWEIFNIDYENRLSNEKTPLENVVTTLDALQKSGLNVFALWQTLKTQAKQAYTLLQTKKSPFPDTTLLRVFLRLLQLPQAKLNTLTADHLNFYYTTILNQTAKLAEPDSTYVCASISSSTTAFQLPEKTLFNAGFDAANNPIAFENASHTSLNPARIGKTYAVFSHREKDNRFGLYKKPINEPNAVKYAANGQIMSWDPFGEPYPKEENKVNLAIAFASPMLLLKDGERTLRFTFHMLESDANTFDTQLFKKATYYLSSAEGWIDVTKYQTKNEFKDSTAFIDFSINKTIAPIAPFVENPDGYTSNWPLFKIAFSSFANLKSPPVIHRLSIDVDVKNQQNILLFNDFGAIDAKDPFPIFGPTPSLNNSFIVGSAEVFSKPLTSFFLQLNWDQLPKNFAEYYNKYNDYLIYLNNPKPVPPKPKSCFKRFIHWIFKPKDKDPTPDIIIPPDLFSDTIFKIGFDVLHNQKWEPFSVEHYLNSSFNSEHATKIKPAELDLFSINALEANLLSYSSFSYTLNEPGIKIPVSVDPYLQLSELNYTDTSTNGFMRMVLTKPPHGFGFNLYPQVVSFIALENAKNISANPKEATIITSPNPPFVPTATGFIFNYTATRHVELNYQPEAYPFECYLYTPFKNYCVYDSTKKPDDYFYQIGTCLGSTSQIEFGIPTFVPFKYSASLFIGLEQLAAAEYLSFYVQLAACHDKGESSAVPDFYFTTTQGWLKTDLNFDSTQGLKCTGLLHVNLPANITSTCSLMPPGLCWLSIASNEKFETQNPIYYFNTNGFLVSRTNNTYLHDTTTPFISANTILSTLNPLAEISAVIQPFHSFNGKAAENQTQFYERVSTRIGTKKRSVFENDYALLIADAFPTVYYSKTVYSTETNDTYVFVMPRVYKSDEPNAFNPGLSPCLKTEIQSFLQSKTSAFNNIVVREFNFLYTRVSASISVLQNVEFDTVQKNVSDGLNVFLSPWINSQQNQLPIDQGINESEVASFIQTIAGVKNVNQVKVETLLKSTHESEKYNPAPPNDCFILAPTMYHHITQDK